MTITVGESNFVGNDGRDLEFVKYDGPVELLTAKDQCDFLVFDPVPNSIWQFFLDRWKPPAIKSTNVEEFPQIKNIDLKVRCWPLDLLNS